MLGARLCPRIVICLLLLADLGTAAEAEATETVLVHGTRTHDVTYPAARWTRGEEWMQGSGPGNRIYAGPELGAGNFTIHAQITLNQVARSAAAFHLGDSALGFAAGQEGSQLFLTGAQLHGGDAKGLTLLEGTNDYIPEGRRFGFVAQRRSRELTFGIAGQIVATVQVGDGPLGRFGFDPMHSQMRLHNLAVKGNLVRSRSVDPSVSTIQPQIDAAIDKGVVYLLKSQQRDGSWGGYETQYDGGQTALSVYALLKAGLPVSHPAVDRGLRYLELVDPQQVYSVSCLMMALQATKDPRYTDRIDLLKEQLLDWQQFTWGYPYSHGAGGWGKLVGRSDLSNTQFAALGLRAAHMANLQVPAKAWQSLIKGTIFHQTRKETVHTEIPEGESGTGQMVIAGFSYVGPEVSQGQSAPTGSMTAAGVATLEICRQGLGDKLKGRRALRADEAIARGVGWLDQNFTVERSPGGGWHIYYLYGLERVGSLLDIEKIGTRPWYYLGANKLIASQGANGSWNSEWDTCFGILFLKRATGPTSDPDPEQRLGYYSSEGEDVDVWLRGKGQSPIELWIPYFGGKVMGEHGAGAGPVKGLRIARIEYLVDGQVVCRIRGNPTRAWDGRVFRRWHHFATAGKHEISARVHLVASGQPLDHTTPDVVIEAKGFTANVQTLYGSWYAREAGGSLTDLLESGRVQVQTSSTNGDALGGENVFDGWQSTRWVCSKEDAAPWIEVIPASAVFANTIVLGQSSACELQRNDRALITSAEVTLNGKDTYLIDLEPGLLRPTAFTLPERTRIRRLKVSAVHRRPRRSQALHCGFSEIALELNPLARPIVTRDAEGMVALACATEGASLFYTLDGSDPTPQSRPYASPFAGRRPCTLQARAFDAFGGASRVATVFLPEHRGGILVDRNRWRIHRVGSQQPDSHFAWMCIDSQPHTFWHTNWQQTKEPYPHELVIDMREILLIRGVTLLPRQVGVNGSIKDCEIYLSEDAENWGEPAWRGVLPTGTALQTLIFAEPAAGRYLRLVARSEQAAQSFASLAELDVIALERR